MSKEEYEVAQCLKCSFLYTLNRPSEDKIGEYYKSDAYVSHTDKDAGGVVNFLYRKVRNYTLEKKAGLIQSLGAKTLLDVGCGTGHFLSACSSVGIECKGLEPDDSARKIAVEQNQVDAEELSALYTLKGGYDIITLWHVLEHVYHLKRDFARFVELLNPGGHLVIAVPNPNSWDAKHYGDVWAAWDVPRHLYHFKEADVRNLAKEFGLEMLSVKPMKFDSFYVSMLSEGIKGKGSLGGLVSGFWNGLRSNSKSSKFGYSSQIYVLKKAD